MRRSRQRLRLRPLRVVLAFAALLAAGALPARAQEGAGGTTPPGEPTVSIAFTDGRRARNLPFAAFAGSLSRQTAALPDGSRQTVDAIELRTLFARAGIARASFSAVTTTREDGLELAVTAPQINQDYGAQVIVWKDADGVLRLLRPRVDVDVRNAELARAGDDGVLTLTLQQGLRLVATPAQVRENELVLFRATPPPGIDTATIEYEWDFNDGSDLRRTRTPTVSHSFKEYGAFNPSVTLIVNGTRFDGDGFMAVEVLVSQPPRVRGERRRDARKANRRNDEDASSTGGDGTTGTGSGSGTGAGGGSGAGTGGAGGTTGPVDPTIAPAPAPPAPPAPQPDPSARRTPPAPSEPAGETVTGYLLASADGAPLQVGGEQRATPQAIASVQKGDPLAIPAIMWVLAGLAGVIVLGWALESRTTLPYFKP